MSEGGKAKAVPKACSLRALYGCSCLMQIEMLTLSDSEVLLCLTTLQIFEPMHEISNNVSFLLVVVVSAPLADNRQKSTQKDEKTSIFLSVTRKILAWHTGSNLLQSGVFSESILLVVVV